MEPCFPAQLHPRGAPLNPESAETPAWQEQFRKEDKEPKKYIHVDEDGAVDESSDRRDELATDMTELKERKVRGARRLERMKEEASMRSAPSGRDHHPHAFLA